MEKDRLEEFKASLEEAQNYPNELNDIEFRLRKRIHHKTKKRNITGLISTAAAFLLFVLVVNTPSAMADALFHIPIIGALAEFVSFDKGLQFAVMNEYAKEVELIEQNNGYTLGVPYVIADSKRLVVFFQIPENAVLQENDYIQINISKIVDTATGIEYEEYTSASSFYPESEQEENDRLSYISIRFLDKTIPKDLQIHVTMSRESFSNSNEGSANQLGNIFEPTSNTQIEQLGEFIFDLPVDDYPEPKVTLLNRDIEVEGQTIRINSITQYPTGTEISVYLPYDNDSIINGLNFKAIDTNGDEWANPGGVISSGPDSKNRMLYYLEGDYFSKAALDTIQINGIRLIKKSEAKITIDLQKKTMTPQPDEIQIESIEKSGNKAYITFTSKASDCFGVFQHEYRDSEGNIYWFSSEGLSKQDDKVEIYLEVVWPKDNKVILTRSMSPMIELKNPVELKLTHEINPNTD
jgi:hypothetical protein